MLLLTISNLFSNPSNKKNGNIVHFVYVHKKLE